MELAGLIFDAIVIAGLGIAIYYCTKLHRDVKMLLDQKQELESFMRQTREQIQGAERNFKMMQISAQEVNGDLETNVIKSKELMNELNFMLEAGESLARRLSGSVESQREKIVPQKTMPQPVKSAEKQNVSNLSKAEQELLLKMARTV